MLFRSRWSVSDDALLLLHADPGLTAASAEVVREGVGNAVRHGGAEHIDVSVTCDGDGLLQVHVADDGTRREGAGEPGLGSRMLDEVAFRWDREMGPQGTVLSASLR